jgi:hypothetical protein
MTNGESTDAEVTESLRALRDFQGPVRLDGHSGSRSGTWLLRWSGVLPDYASNTDAKTIIRTESWDRYLKVVRMALGISGSSRPPVPF